MTERDHPIHSVRIYCEVIPWGCLSRLDVVYALERFVQTLHTRCDVHVELIWKVELDTQGVWMDRLAFLRTHVPSLRRIWLWGQLAHEDGVFANVVTWEHWMSAWYGELRRAAHHAVQIDGLLVDLEPNVHVLEHSLRGRWGDALSALRTSVLHRSAWYTFLQRAERDIQHLSRTYDLPLLAACFPIAVGGSQRIFEEGARILGTPLVTTGSTSLWSGLACMNYPSFAFPFLGGEERPLARSLCVAVGGLIARSHVRVARSLGTEADVICGLNAPGIFEDEPVWSTPERMEPFIRACVRARPDVLSVFNLCGILFGSAHAPTPNTPLHPDLSARWINVLSRSIRCI